MNKIIIKDVEINITGNGDEDYISLTDLAKLKNKEFPNDVIRHWLRRVDTLNLLTLWETMNNPYFKPTDFGGFECKPGENAFAISTKKWIDLTNAIGLKVKSGKANGGTFAHHDIALEFASWISPEIKLYIIKEFKRLKQKELDQLEWDSRRLITKLNYLIHTNAIKEHLMLIDLTESQKNFVYASEADLLNVALFGVTASEWKSKNLDKKGNIRDYAAIIELSILSNLEFYNSKLIANSNPQKERLIMLNNEANKEKTLFNKNNEKTLIEKK